MDFFEQIVAIAFQPMILNSEYPAPAPSVRNILVALAFGIFIAFFLIFFEPFNIDIDSGRTKVMPLLFYGFITSLVLFVSFYVLPLLVPFFFDDSRWKVKHQILFCCAVLFVIATLNGVFTNYINGLNFTWRNYWWIINRTFILGAIPFSFLILLDTLGKNYRNVKEARTILQMKPELPEIEQGNSWTITTDLKNEHFILNDTHFEYAVAHGNYIDVYRKDEDKTYFKTYRINLSSFEKQLNAPYLQRCHRSYLINLTKVSHVTGNAQGLKLGLIGGDVAIPVSRKYIPVVRHFFSQYASSLS
ncbi:MAG: LytTR family DNA-binding domain-containing protein [Bacteroidota bacterium]